MPVQFCPYACYIQQTSLFPAEEYGKAVMMPLYLIVYTHTIMIFLCIWCCCVYCIYDTYMQYSFNLALAVDNFHHFLYHSWSSGFLRRPQKFDSIVLKVLTLLSNAKTLRTIDMIGTLSIIFVRCFEGSNAGCMKISHLYFGWLNSCVESPKASNIVTTLGTYHAMKSC